MNVNAFEILTQTKSKFNKAANTAAPFKLTISRASYAEISGLLPNKGDALFWSIIGIVFGGLFLCILGVIRPTHKYKGKINSQDEEDEYFKIVK